MKTRTGNIARVRRVGHRNGPKCGFVFRITRMKPTYCGCRTCPYQRKPVHLGEQGYQERAEGPERPPVAPAAQFLDNDSRSPLSTSIVVEARCHKVRPPVDCASNLIGCRRDA